MKARKVPRNRSNPLARLHRFKQLLSFPDVAELIFLFQRCVAEKSLDSKQLTPRKLDPPLAKKTTSAGV